jgi:hypothetical protein
VANSNALLQEFEQALTGQLRQVYPKNADWTGITVLLGKKIDFTASPPKLTAFREQFGRRYVLSATYFNLAPQSVLHRHRDMNGNLLFSLMRLHISLKTNPKAIVEVQKKTYHMPADTLWALDTSGLHVLEKSSDENRIHLVVDVKDRPETAKYFPALSLPVAMHLTGFVFIVAGKVLPRCHHQAGQSAVALALPFN